MNLNLETKELQRSVAESAEEHYTQEANAIYEQTDRMFAVLMLIQWVGGIAVALLVSPQTWIGEQSATHPHVLLAIVGGGVLALAPVVLAIFRPAKLYTRIVISISQVAFSSLLIHLSGGRIETHFHIFGSLALLAAYRDWRVLAPATLFVALDHFARGVYWPESVFGIATASHWRWLEHAAWVLLEVAFLSHTTRVSVLEMKNLAQRTAYLEVTSKLAEESERRAEAASEAKSQFLANMSHEIRTPLNGILGFADILARDGESVESGERKEYLKTILHSSKHLLTVINDILDLSKIEAGQMQIDRSRCSPHYLIAETLSILRVRAIEKGIGLEFRWAGLVPDSIHTDPLRLKQLIMNLVGNAIKFTVSGRVLVIAKMAPSNGDEPQLIIEVGDTGIGIAEDKLEQIFEPFVQADSSVTREFGGTGLGLAISRKIAIELGGDLKAQSRVGHGSTFTASVATGNLASVEMLEHPPQLEGADVLGSKVDTGNLQGLKILVADDAAANRNVVGLILRRAGAIVDTVENGRQAVERASKEDYGVVLMDMQMPVMDGYTAARKLRSEGYLTPIIALTAHAMKGDREKCEEAGCHGYVSKPIDRDDLYRAILHCVRLNPSLQSGGAHTQESVDVAAVPTGCSAEETPRSSASDVTTNPESPIHSSLPTDDEELREIVEGFFDSLDEKLQLMETALQNEDFDTLAQLAHWLKGTGGTAGYHCITEPALLLEAGAREADNREASNVLCQLKGIRERMVV